VLCAKLSNTIFGIGQMAYSLVIGKTEIFHQGEALNWCERHTGHGWASGGWLSDRLLDIVADSTTRSGSRDGPMQRSLLRWGFIA
jgi:hypothetical protein